MKFAKWNFVVISNNLEKVGWLRKVIDLQQLFETSNPPPITFSPNAKAQTNEKSDEIIFKKPKTPRKIKKPDMDYPEPEGLAPIGDIDTELCECENLIIFKLHV